MVFRGFTVFYRVLRFFLGIFPGVKGFLEVLGGLRNFKGFLGVLGVLRGFKGFQRGF